MKSQARSHAYAVDLRWTGAAHGSTLAYGAFSREHELIFARKPILRASADPYFRGAGDRYNPEELLVAALSSCHMLSYLAYCALNALAVIAYDDSASGTMEETGGSGAFTLVTLKPRVVVDDDRLELACELHHTAHTACFIANSVNFPVACEPEIARYAG
jgi:organic hydroperoxide reductase OsmC/OhrA